MPKRKDDNHREIQQALERAGALVIDCTPAPSLHFDCIVIFRGRLHIVEIKNPLQPPSARRLTPGEARRKEQIEYKGVPYNTVETIEQALKLIGAVKG